MHVGAQEVTPPATWLAALQRARASLGGCNRILTLPIFLRNIFALSRKHDWGTILNILRRAYERTTSRTLSGGYHRIWSPDARHPNKFEYHVSFPPPPANLVVPPALSD